ncbi:MAG TPA: anti-sigma factor [Sphingopyxis sp.]|nr:anti-sigma factor [Sphingopyxis sp.]
MSTDHMEDFEIIAYVDGELDLPRRLAVEDYLSRNPSMAAQVMADFRTRSALQMLAGPETISSPSLSNTIETIRKSRPSMPWRRPAFGLGIAAVLAIAAVVIPMWDGPSAPPSYVAMAIESHRANAETPRFASLQPFADRDHTLLMASRIAVPRLPDNWRVTNVEMLNAAASPTLLIAVQTAEGDELTILAMRGRSSAPKDPDAVRSGDKSVAYWRRGDFSYALTGNGNPAQLDATADALAESWRT